MIVWTIGTGRPTLRGSSPQSGSIDPRVVPSPKVEGCAARTAPDRVARPRRHEVSQVPHLDADKTEASSTS